MDLFVSWGGSSIVYGCKWFLHEFRVFRDVKIFFRNQT